ncbi:MAG: serine hydrolase domain-containing protein, partial [Saprospiraceae bacterium]
MKPIYLLLLALLLPLLTHAQSKAQLKEEIAKVVHFDTKITHDEIPGYVIGIIVGDSMFTYGYGQIAKEIEQVPDENSLFEVGSVTKLFTASLAGLLADEGVFSHDSPLNDCLPKKYRNSKLDHVTIGSLLTHTSGLPKIPNSIGLYEEETNNPYAHYSKELLLDYYSDFVPETQYLPVSRKKKKRKAKKAKPSEKLKEKQVDYIYSHLNYALLEVAMEHVTGQTYEALMQDRVFSKVGMHQSLTQCTSGEEAERLTPGYARNGLKAAPRNVASFGGT